MLNRLRYTFKHFFRMKTGSVSLNCGVDSEKQENFLILQKANLPFGIFPSQFSINLGSAPCNHKCLFCPQSVKKPKKAEWLDLTVLEKALNEMPTKNINLNVSSYSETMSCPILFPALEMMKRIRPDLTIVLATNGSMITEDHVRRLINIGLEMLSFSFDASDRDSYRKLMQVDDFEKAERNLEMVCRIRSELGSNMIISTHIMAFENQSEGFEDFKRKWEGKVDTVAFRAVGNWGDEGLDLKKRLAQIGFIPIYKKPERRYPCTSVFMHFKLGIDGFYYPCVAYIPGDVHKSKPIGDARKITFNEAWARMEEIRQKHLSGKWNECPYCQTCDVWGLWEDMWFEKDGSFDIDGSIKKLNCWEE